MARAAKLLVSLVCWKEELTTLHAAQLVRSGIRVEPFPREKTGGIIGYMRDFNPSAVVIDLDRLPSQGREVGMTMRASKSTRHIPVIFAGGLDEKVARLRNELPDATYTSWEKVPAALKQALANPRAEPLKVSPHMERFAANDLPRKLGLLPGVNAALLNDRHGFAEVLGDLPEGVAVSSRVTSQTSLALIVAVSSAELAHAYDEARARLPASASFWIIYPKKEPRAFNEHLVREVGLAAGFVDYKVAGVNADWSALKFATRKSPARKK